MGRAPRAEPFSRSPAELFEAARSPGGTAELQRMGVIAVARPGGRAAAVREGDVVLRRLLGEGRLTVAELAAGGLSRRAELEALGIPCEGADDGLFVPVQRDGAATVGRQVATADGTAPPDTAVLRLGAARRRWRSPGALAPHRGGGALLPAAPFAEDAPAGVAAGLLEALLAIRARRRRSLREEDLRAIVRSGAGAAAEAFQRAVAVAELDQRVRGPAGTPGRAELLEALAGPVLAAAERQFILDPARSTLELLEPGERDRYLRVAWDADDFPGGAHGPNEARAEGLFAALARLRPERRPNSGSDAVVQRDELDAAMQRRVAGALAPVPDERGHRLHREAAEAYVRMRTAAAGDGVTLTIGSSYRSPARAAASAARAGNAAAVASFSSHSLGLAVDLRMAQGGLRFAEATTRPFQNVVDMYRSPVHKWMFLRGEDHGWFPYRREPWHWEYNPPGFRTRFRGEAPAATAARDGAAAPSPPAPAAVPAAPAPAAAPSPSAAPAAPREDAGAAEVASDPVAPIRPAIVLRGSVGRGARNRAADVRAVQDRLVELRELAAADAAAERPSGTAAVAERGLRATIAAIESFQRHVGQAVTGAIDGPAAQLDLDRAIPHPTAAELAAVQTRRAALVETVDRGLTIGGPVGAVGTGNAPADVAAVQRRLVALGVLASAHGEAPAAGATAPVPQGSLRRTIAAIRTFQRRVGFWAARGEVAGGSTAGVVAPGDATAALLDRIAVHEITSGTDRLRLQDHVVSDVTESPIGVRFDGIASPSAIPVADWVALGLTAPQAAALRHVSLHEGNFDAINTYDTARVSAGFVQFAGGRGLPPYLALLKSRRPASFRTLLQELGIDVEFTVASGRIRAARVAVLDPTAARVLRAADAEQAIRADKKLTAALILSGRDGDVQRVQIEAAIRDYVLPSLDANVSWGTVTAALRDLLRSEQGMAMLFDRAIQEGTGGGRIRFERVIRAVHAARAAATSADLQAREADVLARVESDLQAAADVAARVAEVRGLLESLAREAGATDPPAVLARPELGQARRKVGEARTRLGDVVNVAPFRGSTIDATLASIDATFRAEDTRLAFATPPATRTALQGALRSSERALAAAVRPVAPAARYLRRIQDIRTSALAAPPPAPAPAAPRVAPVAPAGARPSEWWAPSGGEVTA
ncbi:MAG TPA: M15 family metallopeptidase [Anaeromyxobacter sp.]|nr:M15 family metallopeptidase [Anaeromyxobacter sp.]